VEALDRLQLKVLKAAVPLMMSPSNYRPEFEQFLMTVSAVQNLSDDIRRVTFQAPEFAEFALTGPDEYFTVIFPQPGQPMTMPDSDRVNVRNAVARLPEVSRPLFRWYTIRAIRPAAAEIDVDVVVHGDTGPGSAWALRARVGDRVGFRAGGSAYRTQPAGGRQLLIADETAMPALYSILESLPSDAEVTAILELPSASFDTPLDSAIRPQLIFRGSAAPGSAALDALRDSTFENLDYAWACGESALATGARRFLVKERDVDRRSIMFSGYWKLGTARN